VPEKRVVRYALVDVNQIRQTLQISDDQLKVQYQQNIKQYQVPNRVHAEHILLMTVGNKTDAEVEEIKKKAEDILGQAKKGAKFEDLAKKYSEDPGTKDKAGTSAGSFKDKRCRNSKRLRSACKKARFQIWSRRSMASTSSR